MCLLLWGLTLLRLGVTRGFGAGLRKTLAASTGNRLSAFLSGTVVTALLQSSMATTLIVASFAKQGMVTVAGGLAVVLGADVGTTLVAQALAFDLSLLSPLFMIAGFIFFKSENAGQLKNIGRILIGLALMLLALKWISTSAAPLKESDALAVVFHSLEKDMIFAVLVAALLTWAVHSSLAMVLLLMSLAQSGVIPSSLALIMVLGANLGGAMTPLVALWGDHPRAFRIPLGNVMARFCGVLVFLPFMTQVPVLLGHVDPDPVRQIVHFHTAFNLALATAFLPLIGVVSRLTGKIKPDMPDSEDPNAPQYLDMKAIDTPSIALASATRETLRMADMVEKMLGQTINAFVTSDENVVHEIRAQDDTIDSLYTAIKTYMSRLSQEFMDPEEAARYVQILTFSTNLEHAGDVIDKNLMPLALKKIRNQHSFSNEGLKEIEHIHKLVMESVRMAESIFLSSDPDLARKLIGEKETIRAAEIEASTSHIERLRECVPETIATSSLHMDIIRDLRRINTYMCTVAYPILEQSGQILSSRLVDEGSGPEEEQSDAIEEYTGGHWLDKKE